jgi:2-polyprenyl-3-methyl-5-hydroxy-6-metoxy-1,4-benzoquinol methylase
VSYKDYGFYNDRPSHMHSLFLPPLMELCRPYVTAGTRVLDVGCGNGATAGVFLSMGCDVVGIDLSETGIHLARRTYPAGRFEVLPADAQILERLHCEPFDLAVSTEVVEHLYDPRSYVAGCYKAVRPGGRFICSTPYHGYVKNLAISLVGRWDRHMNPLWDGGHIKLWSRRTLNQLLLDSGFRGLRFRGVGRFPFLWMTMLISADKPH